MFKYGHTYTQLAAAKIKVLPREYNGYRRYQEVVPPSSLYLGGANYTMFSTRFRVLTTHECRT